MTLRLLTAILFCLQSTVFLHLPLHMCCSCADFVPFQWISQQTPLEPRIQFPQTIPRVYTPAPLRGVISAGCLPLRNTSNLSNGEEKKLESGRWQQPRERRWCLPHCCDRCWFKVSIWEGASDYLVVGGIYCSFQTRIKGEEVAQGKTSFSRFEWILSKALNDLFSPIEYIVRDQRQDFLSWLLESSTDLATVSSCDKPL